MSHSLWTNRQNTQSEHLVSHSQSTKSLEHTTRTLSITLTVKWTESSEHTTRTLIITFTENKIVRTHNQNKLLIYPEHWELKHCFGNKTSLVKGIQEEQHPSPRGDSIE